MTEHPRNVGSVPFPHLRYCARCCMPETNEGMAFDELGICLACRSQEQKMRFDWSERERSLRKILDAAKERGRKTGNYDCMVPISGGKDSVFQLHILCKVYGVNPLAVTFSHNWWTETGKKNLWNMIEVFDVDHIMFTPKRKTVNNLARQSLPLIGDSCWHCHAGIIAFPFQIAVKYDIPLVVYGESFAEAAGRSTYLDEEQSEKELMSYALQNSAKVSADQMISDQVSEQDLRAFNPPGVDELQEKKIKGIHLGDYIFWDGERQTEFIVNEYGWLQDKVEGSYKHYKSVECRMSGVHDYSKYIKRGFGRGTDFACQDVRAGLMTRQEALDLAHKVDSERPGALDYYLSITGYTEEEFNRILREKRTGKAVQLP